MPTSPLNPITSLTPMDSDYCNPIAALCLTAEGQALADVLPVTLQAHKSLLHEAWHDTKTLAATATGMPRQ